MYLYMHIFPPGSPQGSLQRGGGRSGRRPYCLVKSVLPCKILEHLFEAALRIAISENGDLKAALAAAQAIEEKSERNQAIAAIAMSVAGKDPEAAYNIIMAQDNMEPYQLSTVFMLWGGQDANAAMAKIETMEIGQNRTHALSGLINGIAQNVCKMHRPG